MAVSFGRFVGIRDIDSGRFERRGIAVLSRATVIFASHRTVTRFFGLYMRLHIGIPRAVGCFYISRRVTLCVRGCIRCHGHGVFFNSGNGVSNLLPLVIGRGGRGCFIPLSDIRGSRVATVLSGRGLRRSRTIVCHAIDRVFRPNRLSNCSVVVFFDPSNVMSLGRGLPRFGRNSVRVTYFNPTATTTVGRTNLHLSLRTPATRTPSVAVTLRRCLTGGGGW